MYKLLLCTLALNLFCISNTQAQKNVQAAKSLYIFNFTRLIDWPEKSGDFIISVVGAPEVADELEKYCAGKSVGLQRIAIRKCESISNLDKCHIVYLSADRTHQISDIASRLISQHTLIISDKEGACRLGAAINFVMEERLMFELKPENALKAGLKVNSKLENMAILVD